MNAKIIVVEDEDVTRKSLADILRLEGYTVTEVANGADALDKIENETFDLMLLDIKMPGMDGVEVLRRTSKIAPDLIVILLTAHGSMESAIEALRFGAHDYLIKPSSPQEILSSITSGLTRRAEVQRKRLLIDQLDTSIQQLRDYEGAANMPSVRQRIRRLPDGIMVDLARREIWQGPIKVGLTPTEGKLLQILLENEGKVLTHRQLVFLVQGYEITDVEAPEVLRPLVSRLRRKLSKFPGGERWIANVRGTGYVLEIPLTSS